MEMNNIFFHIFCMVLVDAVAIKRNIEGSNTTIEFVNNPDNVFDGVYAECFLHLSYTCLQKKTLAYIKELNNLSEVSVVGDFVKFDRQNDCTVPDSKHSTIQKWRPPRDIQSITDRRCKDILRINTTGKLEDITYNKTNNSSEELELMIDKAVNRFFSNHVLKFSALGSDISMAKNVDEFVGRKKRKGGGGGGGDHGDNDGGKKKMMMMAMMCMKMKLMIMVPAMMGMMGMMSFKGMMFSMMSFMISKMMLLMKILEKKGGGAGFGGGAGGASDGVWATGGGGGGAWMPAGGQDFGGGGYDANAQWQSRSIYEMDAGNKPIISYVTPVVRYDNIHNKNDISTIRTLNDVIRNKINDTPKTRRKRDIIDILHKTYTYWINKIFGISNTRRNNINTIPKYRTVNGVKYVFHPFRTLQKVKMIKDAQGSKIKTVDEGFKPIITADDFNKGEIYEGAVESRMNRKKFHKMKDAVNDTVDDNPWQ